MYEVQLAKDSQTSSQDGRPHQPDGPARLLHPIILTIAENALVTPTAAGTGNNSILRSFAFIIRILISYLAISNGQSYIRTTGFSGPLFAGNIFEKSNMQFYRLLLRQWAFGETHIWPLDVPEKERKKRSRLDLAKRLRMG
jgi:hypothetical protein